MAAWVRVMGCPIDGVPGVLGLAPGANGGALGAEAIPAAQDLPNRNGVLFTGNGCAFTGTGPCPEAVPPPGDGTEGVHDGFLCF